MVNAITNLNGNRIKEDSIQDAIVNTEVASEAEDLRSFIEVSPFGRATDTKVQLSHDTLVSFNKEYRQEKDAEDEAALIAMRLSDMSEKLSAKDLKEMDDEKTPYEEYTDGALERAITRVKEGRKNREEALQQKVEKKKLTREQTEKVAEVIALADNSKAGLSDSAKAYMLKNDNEITVGNIYKAVHAAPTQAESVTSDNVWNEIRPQAEKMLEAEGVPVNEGTLENAKWLFGHEIDIDGANMAGLQGLNEFESEGLASTDVEKLERAAAEGDNLHNTPITNAVRTRAEYAVNKWNSITAKRQMYETSYKMTVEAAEKMLEKGIQIDATNMAEIVKELRAEEDDYFASLLEEAGAEVNDDSINVLKGTLEARDAIAGSSAYNTAALMRTNAEITLAEYREELHEITGTDDRQMANAIDSYEQMGTEVRRDLGDSIKKAFRSVDDLLRGIGLDENEANERATRILGYNGLEITEENVEKMRYYDALVSDVTKSLKPAVVTQMIKEGINPLETSFPELEEHVTRIAGRTVNSEANEAAFLWNLDRQGALTEDEREAYVGIYRMLRKIERSDGAAIGATVNAGMEINLKNLLTSARTLKGGHMDRLADDSTGEREQGGYRNSITDSITEAFARIQAKDLADNLSSATEEYSERLAEELRETLGGADDTVKFLMRYGENVTPAVLEAAKEMLNGETKGGAKRLSSFVRKLGRDDRHLLKELSDEMYEAIDDSSRLTDAVSAFSSELDNMVNKETNNVDITYEALRSMKVLHNNLELAKRLAGEEHYEMPFVSEDGSVKVINLTVRRTGGQNGKLDIKAQTEDHMEVSAALWLEREGLTGTFTCEDKEVLATLYDTLTEVNKDITSEEAMQMGNVQRMYRAAKQLVGGLRTL